MSEAAAATRWLTSDEVAARLRISRVTACVWARTGRGPKGARKSGRRILWPEDSVVAYEAALPAPRECAG